MMLMPWLDYQLICVCKGTFKENFYEIGQNYKQKKNERIDSNKKHLILKICWQIQLSTNIFEIKKTFSYNYVTSKIKMHGQKYKDYWVDDLSEPHIELNARCSSVFRPITEWMNSLVISQFCCKLTDHSRHGARNSRPPSYLMPLPFDGRVSHWLAVSLDLLDHPLVVHHRRVIISQKRVLSPFLGIVTDLCQIHLPSDTWTIKYNAFFKVLKQVSIL